MDNKKLPEPRRINNIFDDLSSAAGIHDWSWLSKNHCFGAHQGYLQKERTSLSLIVSARLFESGDENMKKL